MEPEEGRWESLVYNLLVRSIGDNLYLWLASEAGGSGLAGLWDLMLVSELSSNVGHPAGVTD